MFTSAADDRVYIVDKWINHGDENQAIGLYSHQ